MIYLNAATSNNYVNEEEWMEQKTPLSYKNILTMPTEDLIKIKYKTANEDLNQAKMQVKALKCQIQKYQAKEIENSKEIADLKLEIKKQCDNEVENAKNSEHPTTADLLSIKKESDQIILDIKELKLKIDETFSKDQTLEDGDFHYQAFREAYSSLKVVVDQFEESVKKASSFATIPQLYHTAISAKQLIPVNNMKLNEEEFDKALIQLKESIKNIYVEFAEVNKSFVAPKTKLDNMDHDFVVQRDGKYFGSFVYRGDKTRLSPADKGFFGTL